MTRRPVTNARTRLKAAGWQVKTSSRIGLRAEGRGEWEAIAVHPEPGVEAEIAYGASQRDALDALEIKILLGAS